MPFRQPCRIAVISMAKRAASRHGKIPFPGPKLKAQSSRNDECPSVPWNTQKRGDASARVDCSLEAHVHCPPCSQLSFVAQFNRRLVIGQLRIKARHYRVDPALTFPDTVAHLKVRGGN